MLSSFLCPDLSHAVDSRIVGGSSLIRIKAHSSEGDNRNFELAIGSFAVAVVAVAPLTTPVPSEPRLYVRLIDLGNNKLHA
jgi:hypothetical protein